MAESEGEVVFSSLQEELEYWKEKALEYRQRYACVCVCACVRRSRSLWQQWSLSCVSMVRQAPGALSRVARRLYIRYMCSESRARVFDARVDHTRKEVGLYQHLASC